MTAQQTGDDATWHHWCIPYTIWHDITEFIHAREEDIEDNFENLGDLWEVLKYMRKEGSG